MSTISGRPTSTTPPPPGPDPFRYGWRFVRIARPDGTEELDQVPLTLEDVLHPEVGDTILQSDPHGSDVAYLKAVSRARLAEDPTMAVISDCQVDFNIPGVKPLGPDLAVFSQMRRFITWSSFDVAEERARPRLVAEVTSPATRSNDIGIKVDYYHRARVPWYVIADVVLEEENERQIELILYRRTRTRYRRIEPDPNGRVWLEPLRLWLGQTRDRLGGFMRLACFDPDTGAEVGDYTAISQALADTQARLEAESRARKAAEKRVRAESRARADAEARIRQLEAELARSRRP